MAGGISELPRAASPLATVGTLKKGDFVTGKSFMRRNYAGGSASIPIDLLARSAPNVVIGFYTSFSVLFCVVFTTPAAPAQLIIYLTSWQASYQDWL